MTNTNATETLTGYAAIAHAEAHDLTLSKHADPTEDARDGLTVSEARDVASEDPSLIWCEVGPELTTEQIRALETEAGGAGDSEQVEICRRALSGDHDARVACANVIAEARLA